jgi:hypothetical protein
MAADLDRAYDCCEHCDHFDPETGTDSIVVDDPSPHAQPCPEGCNGDQVVSRG